ncbi:hypothetical protein C0583_06125 [Candidatus Parcubacteria bacterium]|nr:MAG: hypothetical protein C0583_06125 [Candidatus Parcubacteria bacterium]
MQEEKQVKKEEEKKEENKKVENEKVCAILAYLLIGVIWFFLDEKMKKSEFAKFHVKQALGLIIADIAVSILVALTLIGMLLYPLLYAAYLVLAVMGIINANNGDKKELPYIGSYASKYLKF